MTTVITVDGLGKEYRLGQANGSNMIREVVVDFFRGRSKTPQAEKTVWALKDISLSLEAGEVLGIVGRNGAGKSTFLKVLSRITRPTTGTIHVRGKVASMLEVGTGFHEELTGRENVYLSGCILGMPKKRIDAKLDEIIAFADVERFIDTPIKRYSSGMRLRLGFSVAAHLESDVLIVDEVLAVGDADFQRKCLQTMSDLNSTGRTVLFVSHNLSAVQSLCSRAIWIESGRLRGDGTPNEIIKSYLTTFSSAQGSVSDLRDIQERSGSGDVRLTRVEFLSPDRSGDAWVTSGDSVVVRIYYESNREVTQPLFGVEVHNSLGIVAAQLHTFNSGFEIPVLGVGSGYIDVLVSDLNLNPGRYLISLWVKNLGDIWHDNLPHCTALEIHPSTRYGLMRGLSKNPIALFDCDWNLVPARDAAEPDAVQESARVENTAVQPANESKVLSLSVVICTWNRAALLRQTLERMAELVVPADVSWELLIVNNNSTDETDEVVRTFNERLPIRRLFEPRPGKSHALNTAVEAASGQYIIYTDDDVLVESSWLSAYAAAFRRWPEASVFGGPILPWYEGTPPRWLMEAFPSIQYAFAALDLGDTPLLFAGNVLPFGANMAVRTADQRQYHYDPALGPKPGGMLRGEETTLLKQMLEAGHQGWWVPDAGVKHFVPQDRQSISYVRKWYQGWGEYVNLVTEPPEQRLFFGRPLWLWRELVQRELGFRWNRLVGKPEDWIEDLKAASVARGRFSRYLQRGS